MYRFPCTPSTNHSDISKFREAVVAISRVYIFKMCLWHLLWARQIRQTRLWFVLRAHRKRHMLINHHKNSVFNLWVIVLIMFYKHMPFWMCPKHEPRRHLEIMNGWGCNLVGVGFQHVAVAGVLGSSDSANAVWLMLRTHRKFISIYLVDMP